MTRRIQWQAAVALAGIALVSTVLFRLTARPQPIATPTAGGTYAEGVVGYPVAINPILASRTLQPNQVDQDLCALVFEGLVSIDSSGQVSPTLATDWSVSEDGAVYEFRLRRGVAWQDGAPFTAADVAFTIQAVQDPGFQGDPALRDLWSSVAVEQVDSLTVRFVLKEPFPSLLYYATLGILPVHRLGTVPASELPASPFSTQEPVGTGRYMVESLAEDRAVLVANPNYWGAQPFIDRVELRFYPDEDGLVAGYERGEILGFHTGRLERALQVESAHELQVYSAALAGEGLVFLNLRRDSLPFFKLAEVRQALVYGLDRQALIDRVLDGQGLVADGPLPPMSWVHDSSMRQYAFDPERARGLLDASGWVDSDGDRIRDKDGVPLSFELVVGTQSQSLNLAQDIAQQWSELGVEAEVRDIDPALVPGLLRTREFDAILAEIGLTADPDPYSLWHSTQATAPGQNFSGWANDQADLLMERGRASSDPEVRWSAYVQFQRVFADQVPSVFLYYPVYTYVVDSRVQGVQLSPLWDPSERFRNLNAWYVESTVPINSGEPLDNLRQ